MGPSGHSGMDTGHQFDSAIAHVNRTRLAKWLNDEAQAARALTEPS